MVKGGNLLITTTSGVIIVLVLVFYPYVYLLARSALSERSAHLVLLHA